METNNKVLAAILEAYKDYQESRKKGLSTVACDMKYEYFKGLRKAVVLMGLRREWEEMREAYDNE